jgi:hypothetical protein
MPAASAAVLSAGLFVSSLGVNTHLHLGKFGYEDFAGVTHSITYLGVKNLRDNPLHESDVQDWKKVADATHVKFDAFVAEGSPDDMEKSLALIPALAAQNILNFVEGGNEEDDPYATQRGNSIATAAAFQRKVYEVGHKAGLQVINLSFGSGWTAANNWNGNYDKVGDLSDHCDFANVHVYPKHATAEPTKTVRRLIGAAKMAASRRPVVMTELGWKADDADEDTTASALVAATFDAALNGTKAIYFYALYDDPSGKFGLMNSDGTPRASGRALHNLTTLLNDSGQSSSTPLAYQLQTSGAENTLLLQKSDGSHWLAVWDVTEPAHDLTLKLPASASIDVYDPVSGTEPVQSMHGATSASFKLGKHPLLLKISDATG